MSRRAALRHPAVAALLSFVFPGLGHAVAGYPRRGLVVAIPAIAFTFTVAALLLFAAHPVADALVSGSGLTSLLLIIFALMLYRLWAIADAYRLAVAVSGSAAVAPAAVGLETYAEAGRIPARKAPAATRRTGVAILAAILIATTGMHVVLGAEVAQIRDAITCSFNPDAPCWFGSGDLAANETAPPVVSEDTPQADVADPAASSGDAATPSPAASGSGPVTPVPTAGPTTAAGIPIFPVENVSGPNTPPSEWAADGYLNVLLLGIDQGVGRWSLRPDTMILLRVQISTGKSVMFGIPRNLENVPLPPESAAAFPCHCFPYPNLLNGLWRDAVNRPKAYPYAGSDFVRGFKALEGAIGQYMGVHVDGSVLVNLMGFVHLIDALGGLNINVPKDLRDSRYARPQDGRFISIHIKAGQQHMNGLVALEYARSRHQDSDYGRMARQQAVLVALRAQLHPCELAPKVLSITAALRDAFWTDMPKEDAVALAGLAEHIAAANIKNIELVPALTGNPVGFLTIPRLATVRNIVAHALDGVTPAAGGGSGATASGGGFSC
jgi:LCP family protein required for cell wall assembly